ncbi:MAG: shikimate kinase [Lachnospiraceae bacterium]|nr:shikimate kinase [Lachnospiraceae bacterium]
MKTNIFLIGFMGTGKSTVSKKLSGMTSMREVDLDVFVEEKAGMCISRIFEEKGEKAFRDMETECLKVVLKQNDCIISCGGGTVIREENVDYMRENGTIVLLTATPETIYQRVKDNQNRPILNGNMNVEYISTLMERRKEFYQKAADVIVETDKKTVEEICNEILEKICKK